MKKSFLFLASILLFTLVSCENYEEEEQILSSKICSDTYYMGTRSSGVTFDQCTSCSLYNGESIKLPWADNSEGSIPYEIRSDVKESDGWRILYSTVNIVGYDHSYSSGSHSNYLLLYNKFTGMLKGFYYATSMQENNNAYWLLTIPNNGYQTKLFNFVEDFASPSDLMATNVVSLSNITNEGVTGGFSQGWNCFMLELAYDPNSQNEILDITGYSLEETTYEFSGSFSSSSKGTIVSTSQGQSSFLKGLASKVGESAKETVDSMNIGGLAQSLLGYAAEYATTDLITYGLNKLLGSVLAQSTPTVQSLQFSTNGHIEISGKSVKPASGLLMPIMGIPLNGIDGKPLGIWNLTEKPKYTINSSPKLVKAKLGSMIQYIYKVEATPSIQYVVNPYSNANISIDYSLVEYTKYDGVMVHPLPYQTTSFLCDAFQTNEAPTLTQTTLFNDGLTIIKTIPSCYTFQALECPPNYTSSDGTPSCDLLNYEYEYLRPVKFKVVATITNGTVNTASAKTFTPLFLKQKNGDTPKSWSLFELASKGYVYNGSQLWRP